MTDIKQEWARLLDENKRLKAEVEILRAEVEAYTILFVEKFGGTTNDNGKPE